MSKRSNLGIVNIYAPETYLPTRIITLFGMNRWAFAILIGDGKRKRFITTADFFNRGAGRDE